MITGSNTTTVSFLSDSSLSDVPVAIQNSIHIPNREERERVRKNEEKLRVMARKRFEKAVIDTMAADSTECLDAGKAIKSE